MMLPHPDTLKTVSDLRWNDWLRTAERERLAAQARARPSSPSAFATGLAPVTRAGAKLASFATALATSRRALTASLAEQS